jgi:DNA-3-methyladenine glycosylase I
MTEGPAPVRCPWALREPSISYHDTEWGVKQTNENTLFELLVLEGAQAGLSWETILRKRAAYRAAFDGFDPAIVATFDATRVETLMANAGIVRHRGKITSAIANARAFMAVQRSHGSFGAYLWSFTDGQPVATHRPDGEKLPPRTSLSDAVSKDLRQRGFSFVGSTIVYAYLQAVGVVDDHFATCFRAHAGRGAM